MHKQQDDRKLANTVKLNWFKHLGELHKEWTEAGVKSHHAQTSSGKGLRSHFWNRNIVRSILPGLRRKDWTVAQWSKVLFSDNWCSNSCKRRPNQVLSAYKLTYFSEAWHFFLIYPFLLSYVIFKFSETPNFGFSLSVSHNHQNVISKC